MRKAFVKVYRAAILAGIGGVLSAAKVTAEHARRFGDGASLSKGPGIAIAERGLETWMPVGGIGIRVGSAREERRSGS